MGLNLRLPVALLVVQQLSQQLLCRCQGISDGRDGVVAQAQPLPSPGAFGMDTGGNLVQLFDKMGPVVNQNSAALGHAQGVVVQGLQQGWLLLPVLQNPKLLLMQPVILRQGGGILGTQLTDAAVQKLSPRPGPFPNEVEVLWAEQHRGEQSRQLSGRFQSHPV